MTTSRRLQITVGSVLPKEDIDCLIREGGPHDKERR